MLEINVGIKARDRSEMAKLLRQIANRVSEGYDWGRIGSEKTMGLNWVLTDHRERKEDNGDEE
jgi:hypothetical protein